MQEQPTPIVVVSGYLQSDVALSLKAIEAGALAVVGKLPARTHPTFEQKRYELLNTLRAMAQVRVIRRRTYPQTVTDDPALSHGLRGRVRPNVLAIGASTGGPGALHHLLSAFPADFPLPVVIAQHMPQEFIPGLVRWLNHSTPLSVTLAESGEVARAGRVLLAPGDAHLMLQRDTNGALHAHLMPDNGQYRYCPSVDALFHSVAQTCGHAAAGLVLTGMGDDGAAGLLAMRRAGAITLAQDETSCVVYGMPGAAVQRGAVTHIETLADLAPAIQKLL
jgi:two-component system chemotaxis response regulator CheB